jgi:hypothetical protein
MGDMDWMGAAVGGLFVLGAANMMMNGMNQNNQRRQGRATTTTTTTYKKGRKVVKRTTSHKANGRFGHPGNFSNVLF